MGTSVVGPEPRNPFRVASKVLHAERLELNVDDPKAGALGAAIAVVVAFTYRQRVRSGGRGQLGEMLAEASNSLGELGIAPSLPSSSSDH